MLRSCNGADTEPARLRATRAFALARPDLRDDFLLCLDRAVGLQGGMIATGAFAPSARWQIPQSAGAGPCMSGAEWTILTPNQTRQS